MKLPDIDTLQQLSNKAMDHVGGALATLMVFAGDRLDLFRALHGAGRASSAEVAARAGLDERVVREWLSACAAAGYVRYHPEDRTFELSAEAAVLFLAEDDPRCLLGLVQSVKSVFDDEDKATRAIRDNRGLAWGERSPGCFCGTERAFGPAYAERLVAEWLPAMEGVTERLESGGLVGDVGCGHGAALIALARAFPRSEFVGFDLHEGSVETGRERARAAGLANVRFDVADACGFPGEGFDLLCMFDALHDLGDPVGAATRMCRALRPGGRLLVLEPLAGDRLEDNLHRTGTIYYGFSTLTCVLAARAQVSGAQAPGAALGAQAGPAALAGVLHSGGFAQVRQVAATATKMVLEAC